MPAFLLLVEGFSAGSGGQIRINLFIISFGKYSNQSLKSSFLAILGISQTQLAQVSNNQYQISHGIMILIYQGEQQGS